MPKRLTFFFAFFPKTAEIFFPKRLTILERPRKKERKQRKNKETKNYYNILDFLLDPELRGVRLDLWLGILFLG